MKKKILIIGGAGFIGHNLALKLNSFSLEVSVIDGLEVNNLKSLINNTDGLPYPLLSKKIIESRLEFLKEKNIPLYEQDARDYKNLKSKILAIKPDIVVHLAAISHAERSNKNPFLTFDHSLKTLMNVLDIVKKDIKHFIFLSSSMVYGNFESKEVTESISIPTIGIGAGGYCDGQVLVMHDILGITTEFKPRFLRQYLNLGEQIDTAIKKYVADVKSNDFPNASESY